MITEIQLVEITFYINRKRCVIIKNIKKIDREVSTSKQFFKVISAQVLNYSSMLRFV